MTVQTSEDMPGYVSRTRILPSVSVVIPVFRGGRFLREAVASVQAQTLKDWEMIIVSDGSEDDLSDIEQNDPRISVFRQRNRGVSIARNVGIGHARSELIAFLDDDDRTLPDRLAAQLRIMTDSNIGLCYTECRVIDENGQPTLAEAQYSVGTANSVSKNPSDSKEAHYRACLRGEAPIVLSSVMVRKSLAQEVGGFNPLLPLAQDRDLVYRIAREANICLLPEILTEYRIHGHNTWTGATTTREMKLVLTQHLLAAEAQGSNEDLKAVRIGLANLVSGRAEFAMRRAREAQLRHDYLALLVALAQALLSSPRGSLRAVGRAVRTDFFGDRSIVAFVQSWIKPSR